MRGSTCATGAILMGALVASVTAIAASAFDFGSCRRRSASSRFQAPIRRSMVPTSTAARSSPGREELLHGIQSAGRPGRPRHLGREPRPPDDPWGPPVNVGAPVNSARTTSARRSPATATILLRQQSAGRVRRSRHLHDAAHGKIGFDAADEPRLRGEQRCRRSQPVPAARARAGRGPVLLEHRGPEDSRRGAGRLVGDTDLYLSERHDGRTGRRELVPGANSASEDGQPNVRRDGHELFFFSNRPGTLGMADIYAATRSTPRSRGRPR